MPKDGFEKTVAVFCMCLIMVAVLCSSAASEEKLSENTQIMKEKILADKKLLVALNMQLTEGESKTFWPIYAQYQDELFILRMRSLQLIAVYAAKYESMTDEVARMLLDEYLTVERLRHKVTEAYLPKFREVLPEIKVIRYYQIEHKIISFDTYELSKQIPLMQAGEESRRGENSDKHL